MRGGSTVGESRGPDTLLRGTVFPDARLLSIEALGKVGVRFVDAVPPSREALLHTDSRVMPSRVSHSSNDLDDINATLGSFCMVINFETSGLAPDKKHQASLGART